MNNQQRAEALMEELQLLEVQIMAAHQQMQAHKNFVGNEEYWSSFRVMQETKIELMSSEEIARLTEAQLQHLIGEMERNIAAKKDNLAAVARHTRLLG